MPENGDSIRCACCMRKEQSKENFQEMVLSQILQEEIALRYTRKICLLKPSKIGQIHFVFLMMEQNFSFIKQENHWKF
jgi:hypothetical protein